MVALGMPTYGKWPYFDHPEGILPQPNPFGLGREETEDVKIAALILDSAAVYDRYIYTTFTPKMKVAI